MRDAPVGDDHRPVGLFLFLAALSTLIGATMVAYLVVRSRAATWPPEGAPGTPGALYVSTLLLLLSSLTVQHAAAGARRGDATAVRRGMVLTLLMAAGFLASQTVAGAALAPAVRQSGSELFTFTFFMLVGLHALHVIGGFIPLGIVTAKAFRGGARAAGVRLVAIYWHYLDVVWLVMLFLLVV